MVRRNRAAVTGVALGGLVLFIGAIVSMRAMLTQERDAVSGVSAAAGAPASGAPAEAGAAAAGALAATSEARGARRRIRDLGIVIGRMAPGPLNAITDVKGVRVGQVTLSRGDGKLRTGGTCGGRRFRRRPGC